MVKAATCAASLCLALVVSPAAGANEKLAALLKQGDEMYAKRSGDKMTRKMIAVYKEAVKLDNKSYEANWKLARAYFWLCDNTEHEDTDKRYGWMGYNYARAAIRLNPKGVDGHYWAAINMGEHSKGLGIITALRKGIEKKFLNPLKKAMRINRGYERGGADRAYGNYWHLLPWPKKDNDKAIKHFKKSLSYDRAMPRTHFYMARVYLDEGDKAAAKRHIGKCLSANPKKGDKMDNYRFRWHCKKFKKKHGL